MERWNGVVATGASGAKIIEFVHTEEVGGGAIQWTYMEVTYALMYPDGSFAPWLGAFTIIYGQLKQFEENWKLGIATIDDGAPNNEFVRGNWPVNAAAPVAPEEPPEMPLVARTRKFN